MLSNCSILVITASPDDRPSTTSLRAVVDELRRRDGVDVTVWMLRAAPEEQRWPDARVVDDLRTGSLVSTLDRFGVPLLPSRVRGLQLRRWFGAAHPDVVVLDDGLGARALPRSGAVPRLVVRRNATLPADALLEDGVAAADGSLLVIEAPLVSDHGPSRAAGEPAVRAATRRRLGVPEDVPLIVGWGRDGWLDGPDLFVRALWWLERSAGVAAHGLWIGTEADEAERRRLVAEAERCGLGARFRTTDLDDLAARSCGDVVLLPYRTSADVFDVHEAVASGLVVVGFDGLGVVDPAVVLVPPLDVEAGAAALATALDGDRSAREAAATLRLDVGPWADEFLDRVGSPP